NDHHRLDPASPWGGFKNSGVGRETGVESVDQVSEPRAVKLTTSGNTIDWYAHDGEPKRLNCLFRNNARGLTSLTAVGLV
ncbi:hypothetical protein SB860_40800, partial [Burkholderia sp. SIMBA_019]